MWSDRSQIQRQRLETTLEDNVWSELIRETTPSSAYSGYDSKNNFTNNCFRFTSPTPITEVHQTLNYQLTTKSSFPLCFHAPSSVLVLDSVGYHSYKTRHSTAPLRYPVEYRYSTALPSQFTLVLQDLTVLIRQFVELTVYPNIRIALNYIEDCLFMLMELLYV